MITPTPTLDVFPDEEAKPKPKARIGKPSAKHQSGTMALILILSPNPVLNPTDVYTLVAPCLQTLVQQGWDGPWRCYQSDRLVLTGHDLQQPQAHRTATQGTFSGS